MPQYQPPHVSRRRFPRLLTAALPSTLQGRSLTRKVLSRGRSVHHKTHPSLHSLKTGTQVQGHNIGVIPGAVQTTVGVLPSLRTGLSNTFSFFSWSGVEGFSHTHQSWGYLQVCEWGVVPCWRVQGEHLNPYAIFLVRHFFKGTRSCRNSHELLLLLCKITAERKRQLRK